MNDAVDLRMRSKDLVERGLVRHVGLVESGALAADELDAVDGSLGRIVEVVNNDNIVPILQQRERSEGANVAGTTTESMVRRVFKP